MFKKFLFLMALFLSVSSSYASDYTQIQKDKIFENFQGYMKSCHFVELDALFMTFSFMDNFKDKDDNNIILFACGSDNNCGCKDKNRCCDYILKALNQKNISKEKWRKFFTEKNKDNRNIVHETLSTITHLENSTESGTPDFSPRLSTYFSRTKMFMEKILDLGIGLGTDYKSDLTTLVSLKYTLYSNISSSKSTYKFEFSHFNFDEKGKKENFLSYYLSKLPPCLSIEEVNFINEAGDTLCDIATTSICEKLLERMKQCPVDLSTKEEEEKSGPIPLNPS